MNRREVMQAGAAVAAASLAVPATAASAAKLRLGAYSRTLHWLRSPEELAAAVREIGNTTIDLTVRDYPGHVQPERVKSDLPRFVETLRRNGVIVDCMAAEITDADTPHVEAMLETAASVGVRHHWWRGFSLDNAKPWQPQIDGFKRRTEGLAKLGEKYGTKAIYHTGNAAANQKLSAARAAAVKSYLIKTSGVSPHLILPSAALGDSPIAQDPDAPQSNDEARRVTVTIAVSKSARK